METPQAKKTGNTPPNGDPLPLGSESGQDVVTTVAPLQTKPLNEVIVNAARLGQVIVVGEWRGFKGETINYTSKKTGQKEVMKMVRHTLECGDGDQVDSVNVSQNLADTFDLERVREMIPFKKGQRVVVVCSGYFVEKGVRSVRAAEMIPVA